MGGGACEGDMYTMMFPAFSLPGSGVEPECCCEKKVTAVAGPVHPCPPDDPWRWDSLAEATRCPIGDRPEPTPASGGATRAGIPSPHPPPTPSAPTQKLIFFFHSPHRRAAGRRLYVRPPSGGCTRCHVRPANAHSAQSQISSHHQHSMPVGERGCEIAGPDLSAPPAGKMPPPPLSPSPPTTLVHQPTPSGSLRPRCC